MNCGVRFECSGADDGDGGWFKAFLGQAGSGGVRGSDAGDEAYRLLTAEGTSPGAVAGMP